MAAMQFDIGCIVDKEYHYQLTLTNTTPIRSKPPTLHPEEEAWLDQHLKELQAKEVIAKLLPHEQPTCGTPLILVPGVQSGEAYRVCQNIIPLNKRTEAYNYTLMDTRRFQRKLGRAKLVSMLNLKEGFHNVPFKETSSYLSNFTHPPGFYRWVCMLMGLT